MDTNQSKIQELERSIKVLSEENSQLAERVEDSLLLSLLSEHVRSIEESTEIFSSALEQISILKGIPFATCGWLDHGELHQIAGYCSFNNDPSFGYPISIPPRLVEELEGVSALSLEPDRIIHTLPQQTFTPTACTLIPFSAQGLQRGLFLFFDDRRLPEDFDAIQLPLRQAVDLIIAKHDNIYLLKALSDSNRELEDRVAQRTRELTTSNEALIKSELKYRQLIENAHDAIFVAQDGKIVFANQKTGQLLDASLEEIYATPFLTFISHEYQPLVESNYRKRLSGDTDVPSTYDFDALTMTGEKIKVEITSVKIEWNDRPATLSYTRDITQLRRMEEALQQSRKLEAIGQLASGIAHDFNNMLGGIIGAAEVLGLHLPDDPMMKKFHRMILDSAERAGELTRKLLSFSRKNPRMPKAVDVHNLIEESVILLANTIDPRIRIDTDLRAETCTVKGEASQLQNILLNLGINSSHAMADGGTLTVSTRTLELDTEYCDSSPFDLLPGLFIEITVQDTGTGIPPETLARIFEPFFTTKVTGEGTGLGLASAYGSVQQHKGSITVQSTQGQGTVFHILLPLVTSVVDTPRSPATAPLVQGGCILVVDDESVMRMTAKAILEDLGYQVVLAENGQDGFEIYGLDPAKFDLVLLDMIMPVMNGRECFDRIIQLNPEARVLLSSGFSKEQDLVEMQKTGLKGVVSKPYRKSDLSQAIANALQD